MPVTVKKNKKGGYTVSTPNQVHAKNTTKANAEAQKHLLNAVEHGWSPSKALHQAGLARKKKQK
jgi:hypothetical protein